MIKAEIKNFTVEELSCRCGCKLLNMDDNFLVRLQAFRLIYGKPLTPTCGGRCVKHNKEVGGEKSSLHENETKKASAADLLSENTKGLYEKACTSKLFNEVIWYKKDNFVHLGFDPNQKSNYFTTK